MYTEAISSSLNHTKGTEQRLKKATEEFESLFLNQMFKSMRKATPDGGLIKKNAGEKLFTDMMDMEIAQQSSKGQSVGLAEMLYDSLSKNIPSTDGNNFPEGNKGIGTSQQYLDLKNKINGTNVAHKIIENL